MVIDRLELCSDLEFQYIFKIGTFWQVRIVARYLGIGEQEFFQLHSAGYLLKSPVDILSWKV